MPFTRTLPDKDTRSMSLHLLLPISAIVLLALLSLYCLHDFRQRELASNENHEATRSLHGIQRELLNAETGHRGYLLTKDASYLEPYHSAVFQVPILFESLSQTVNSPKLVLLLDEMKVQTESKFTMIQASIDAADTDDASPPVNTLAGGNGRRTMDKLRSLVGRIDRSLQYELQNKDRDSWRAYFTAITLAAAAFLIALCVIIISYVRVGRELMMRADSDRLLIARTTQLQSFADIACRIVTCPDVDSIVGIALNEFRALIGTREALLKFTSGEVVRIERGVSTLGVQKAKPCYIHCIFELARLLSRGEATFFRHRPEIDSWPEVTSTKEWAEHGDSIESILTAPILNIDRVEIGRFILLGKIQGRFNGNDLSIVSQLAFILSAAIENTRLNEKVIQASLRKDEFLAMLGHELRNPLAGVVTGVEALQRISLDEIGSEERKLQDTIYRQATLMQHIIEDLLDVSRIGQGKVTLNKSDCNVEAITRHTVRDHQCLHPNRSIQVKSMEGTSGLVVFGDQTRLSQCLTNLLNNACKFSKESQPIVVGIAHQWSTELNCDCVSISVSDLGIGLSKTELSSIFELFYQANDSIDRSQGGLGIGLTLSKGLVELHGGMLTVSSPGKDLGCTFEMMLPIKSVVSGDDSDVLASDRPSKALIEMPIAPIRILAIDDRTDALLPIRVLMTRDGHQVVEAQNGPDGVHLAKSFHPDMVLCDIGLPGAMNGYDVAQAMRADPELKKLYLVALSGYSQPSDRKRAQTSGFDFHVAKPIKLAMLRNLVANRPRF
jgi:signal transduction histidine kinase